MKPLSGMTEREYFASVGRRPGMFVGKTSFHMLTAFLTGYDQHALRHGGPGLTGWHDWLVARRGRDCNHAWPGQVLHIALPNGWARHGSSLIVHRPFLPVDPTQG
jgi:hypothetical protein